MNFFASYGLINSVNIGICNSVFLKISGSVCGLTVLLTKVTINSFHPANFESPACAIPQPNMSIG